VKCYPIAFLTCTNVPARSQLVGHWMLNCGSLSFSWVKHLRFSKCCAAHSNSTATPMPC